MSRIKGSFITSNNYEVEKAAPFDARMLVKKKSDLTDPSSWSVAGRYNGMIVAVGKDPEKSNNGLYILTDVGNIESEGAWLKFANISDLQIMGENLKKLTDELGDIRAALEQKQDKLVAGKNIIIEDNVISAVGSAVGGSNVIQIDKLPESGEEDTIYCVGDEKSLYMWKNGSWLCYGRDYNEISILLGGTSVK